MPDLADAAVEYGLQPDRLSPDYHPGVYSVHPFEVGCNGVGSYPSKWHCHEKPKLQLRKSQSICKYIWIFNLCLRTMVIVNGIITRTRIYVISFAAVILMAGCTRAVILNVTWPSFCKI